MGKGKDDEDDDVCLFMHVCVLCLYVCMFFFHTYIHAMLSPAPEAAGHLRQRLQASATELLVLKNCQRQLDDDVMLMMMLMYICMLVLYICMFSCLMHKDLSSATELLVISARGSWIKKGDDVEVEVCFDV